MNDFEIRSLADVETYLGIYRQSIGSAMTWCTELGGVEYKVATSASICRIDDDEAIAAANEFAARALARIIDDLRSEFDDGLNYGQRKRMEIFWRVKPETGMFPYERVIEYRADGPDTESISDRKCVIDRRWVVVRYYARLAWGIPKTAMAEPA